MSERKKYDIAIVGSGPGGYVAAIKAAQLGKSVALIEKGELGGCCLNVGCIPTKTLLSNASVLHQVKRASDFGIVTGPISFHYDQMKKRKDQVISKIRGGLEGLLKSNKITIYRGAAQFESPHLLKITGQDNLYIEQLLSQLKTLKMKFHCLRLIEQLKMLLAIMLYKLIGVLKFHYVLI